MQRGDIIRWQSVFRNKIAPLAIGESAQASCGSHPDCSVTDLYNRIDNVGAQAISSCVSEKFSIPQPAQTTAGCSGPHRAIMTSQNRIDVVLCEPIGLFVCLHGDGLYVKRQMAQSSLST